MLQKNMNYINVSNFTQNNEINKLRQLLHYKSYVQIKLQDFELCIYFYKVHRIKILR